MEVAKKKIISLIKSGRMTKENGQKSLQIYAKSVKQGKPHTIEQIVKAYKLLSPVKTKNDTVAKKSTETPVAKNKYVNPHEPHNPYYKQTGEIGTKGPTLIFTVGIIITFILGWLYGYAVYFIPIVYFNFFITLIYGGALGFCVGMFGKIGKIRNPKAMMWFGIAIGVIGCYTQWAGSLGAITESYSASLGDIFKVIGTLGQRGAWEIFGWEPRGFSLYLIWFIEALMIIGACTLMSYSISASDPYCANCDTWVTKTHTITGLNKIANPTALVTNLENGISKNLFNLGTTTYGSRYYTNINLVHCDGCDGMHFLNIDSITIEKDKDNNDTTSTSTVLSNLIISKETHSSLREQLRGKKV